jgi:hypothetical protein
VGDATPADYHYDRDYKTTDTIKRARADGSGHGSTNYYISSATPGYRVYVDVYVSKPGGSGHCRTSFVPHR